MFKERQYIDQWSSRQKQEISTNSLVLSRRHSNQMTNLKSENATAVRNYVRFTNDVMIILEHAVALSADYQYVNRSLEYKKEDCDNNRKISNQTNWQNIYFSETNGFVKQSSARWTIVNVPTSLRVRTQWGIVHLMSYSSVAV